MCGILGVVIAYVYFVFAIEQEGPSSEVPGWWKYGGRSLFTVLFMLFTLALVNFQVAVNGILADGYSLQRQAIFESLDPETGVITITATDSFVLINRSKVYFFGESEILRNSEWSQLAMRPVEDSWHYALSLASSRSFRLMSDELTPIQFSSADQIYRGIFLLFWSRRRTARI